MESSTEEIRRRLEESARLKLNFSGELSLLALLRPEKLHLGIRKGQLGIQ
jgi:hypothetical protein